MPTMNLLTEPLLRVRSGSAERALSLPALMAALGRESDVSLPGLQRHQADAFHVFLCYLAGAVLARAGEHDPIQDETFWREGLRALAGEAGDDAWTLVVEDLARPAFMQPPIPPREHGKLKLKATTPDALDLLPTAKNHDVKQARAAHAHPDEWVYALVSLQTMSGFFGRGNQGISRMNSGFGNRPVVELVRSLDPAPRWRDAVPRLLRHRQEILEGSNPWRFGPDGLVLVWLREWDGRTSLATGELDPCYVEVCRRIRLRAADGDPMHAEALPADSPRIAARELNGVVGDAWLPVDVTGSEQTSLTVSPQGLTADLLRRLLFADGLQMTSLHRPGPDWQGPLWLSVSVLVRGKGTTDGFHERELPIPAEARPRLFGPPQLRERFA
ncbi:MAG TPA: type I-E CRISPR-associated protein Cse1/CasA, partial [Oceanithermus profundus]|nr:type I-E CRISPR-associated protein Cse1/CasA [Oceanithermus profundus]